MRVIFMGTPAFAVPVLDALVAAGHEIAAVYCQPPRPAGRGQKPRPSPVAARAGALGIALRTPVSLKGVAEQEAFAALGLSQHPRLSSAALAGGGPDPPRDHGRRCRDGGVHHADGGRA